MTVERFKEGGYEIFTVASDLPHGFNKTVKEILLSKETPSYCKVLSSSSSTVVFSFECGDKSFLFKKFMCRGNAEGIKSIFKGSRAVRANSGAVMLASAGLLTPKVCGYGHEDSLFKGTSFLVTEFLDDAFNLYEYIDMFKAGGSFKEISTFMKCLGTEVGKMHRASIIHGDLRPGNVMVKIGPSPGEFQIYFIDNERNRKFSSTAPRKLIIKNLVQLNMVKRTKVKFSLRAVFYKSYIDAVGKIVGDKKELARQVWKATEIRMNEAKHGGIYS